MKHTFITLLPLFLFSTASAQYKGGSGTGTTIVARSLLSLSTTNTMYSGGSNDGNSGISASLLSLNAATQYSGGTDDGSSSVLKSNASLNASGSYAGGSDDGSGTAAGTALSLLVPGMYAGGADDGSSGIGASALALSSSSTAYSGGADDGSSALLGSSLNMSAPGMYSGGSNDGASGVTVSAVSVSTATMYAGGADDGSSMAFAPAQSIALPLTWEDFSVMHQGSDALLQWQVGNDRNDAGFNIERSYDGNAFTKTGFVAASHTISATNDYRYIDADPAHYCPAGQGNCSEVYYRLRQLTPDGHFSFSPVKRLNLDQASLRADVYPNPASGSLNIRINSPLGQTGGYSLALYNSMGATVLSHTMLTQLALELNVQEFASGIYYLNLTIDGHTYPYQITIKH